MNPGFVFVGPLLGPAAPPISGGEVAADEAAVVALLAFDEEREAAAVFCSGTVIESQAVLTAAHCLDEADRLAEQGFVVVVASGVDLIRQGVVDVVRADGWRSHPSWQGFAPPAPPRFDVGVVFLERGLAGTEVARLGEQAPTRAWEGERLELVGFGATSLGAGDGGTKRSVVVDWTGFDSHFVFIDSPGRNVCEGDSGGPMFRAVESDRYVVGVHSYVVAEDPSLDACSEGQGASHRVDTVVDWIRKETDVQGVGAGDALGAPSGSVASLDVEEPVACAAGRSGTGSPRSWAVLWGTVLVWPLRRARYRGASSVYSPG